MASPGAAGAIDLQDGAQRAEGADLGALALASDGVGEAGAAERRGKARHPRGGGARSDGGNDRAPAVSLRGMLGIARFARFARMDRMDRMRGLPVIALLWPLATLLAACVAAAPGVRPDPSARVAAPSASGSASASTSSSASAATGSCVIASRGLSADEPITLRTPSGAPFATMLSADESRFTADRVPTLEVAVFGLRLRTAPRGGDFPFYARRARMFGGIVRPGGETKLDWVGTDSGGALAVKLPADPRLEWIATPPLDAVSCVDLALAPQAFGEPPTTDVALDGTAPIALAAAARGAPVAWLKPSAAASGLDVAITAVDGTQVRIDWLLDDGPLQGARVIGWIDRARTRPSTAGGATSRCFGGLGLSGVSGWSSCHKQHPLHVQTPQGIEPIGTIEIGTRVRRLGSLPPWTAVEILGPSTHLLPQALEVAKGATFLMRDADATDCE
jgi:hypothetical protein